MITHEEAMKNLISLTAKFIIPSVEETDYGCLYDRCHFYNSLDSKEQEWLKSITEYITQQEQFAKDVARYFDLDDFKTSLTQQEWEEYKELRKTIQKGVAK